MRCVTLMSFMIALSISGAGAASEPNDPLIGVSAVAVKAWSRSSIPAADLESAMRRLLDAHGIALADSSVSEAPVLTFSLSSYEVGPVDLGQPIPWTAELYLVETATLKRAPVTAEARTWESGRAISHAPLTQVGQILDRFVEDFSESLTAANSGDQ